MSKKRVKPVAMMVILAVCILCLPLYASAASKARISSTAKTLNKGQTYKLKVSGTKKKVKWSSSNPKVAKVNSAGKVTAKKVGTATITAKADGKTTKCRITVRKKVLSKKKAQHQKYVSYIKKFNQKNQRSMEKYRGIMYTASYPGCATYFAFVDIDGDGTDECIVKFADARKSVTTANGAGGQIGRTEIYTIKDGKIKTLLKQDAACCGDMPGIMVYKNSSLIEFYTSGHSITGYDFYLYANGSISKTAQYSCHYMMGGHYYINDLETTQRNFIVYLNQVLKNKVGYQMHKYTSVNLKKFI